MFPPNTIIDPINYGNNKYTPITVLNKDSSVVNCDVDYVKINGLYASIDPRTFDSPRAQRLYLDSPPLVSSNTQPQGDLYNMRTNHTGFYKDYQSIYGGDIVYYTDLDIADPYGYGIWINPSYTVPQLLVDPMGGVKPYYKRVPIFSPDNNNFEYSFDRDQCEFREDLIAKQQEGGNTSDFAMFQLFNNPKTYFPGFDPNMNGRFPLRNSN